ncbi:hypothetical protein Thein_0111 [Thermodesulfatator indicus DSM 15286]|uniref:Uncharacterized protein n=1 Tax=Thermodesulfatator indicus (strain DSM 15286 / JCM 11887 / CIR29812) TaxID=667014 RepID=F8A8U9_THEID|nr:hypothetical protein [Thermodesulfatator indicus]AEH43996.1 hypothetical protein Thein_0111 [Thermodesulfatator indicus DSM 15286]
MAYEHWKKFVVGSLVGAVAFASAYILPAKKARAEDRIFAAVSFPLSRDFLKGARVEGGFAHLDDNTGYSAELFVAPFQKTIGVGADLYAGTEDLGGSLGAELGYNIPNHSIQEALRARIEALKGATNLGVRLPLDGIKPKLSGLELTIGGGTQKWVEDKKEDPATTTSSSNTSTPTTPPGGLD